MKFRIFIGICLTISSLMLICCGSPEEKKMKYFNKGMALYEKGEYAKARVEFKSCPCDRSQICGRLLYDRDDGIQEEKTGSGPGEPLYKAVELNPDLLDAEVALGQYIF